MKLYELYEILDSIAPFWLAEEYDNSGIQCGDENQNIQKILLALDCTEQVAEEAVNKGVDAVVTHHPIIFKPIYAINEDEPSGRTLRTLIKNDISLIACHTNLDNAEGGESLAELFEIKNTAGLKKVCEEKYFGRIGNIEPVTLEQLAQKARKVLGAKSVKYAGDKSKLISRLAVAGGSGSEILEYALNAGAGCFITGEIKYSDAIKYASNGLCIIDAGHYDTEKQLLVYLRKRLQTELVRLQYNMSIDIAESCKNVFDDVK